VLLSVFCALVAEIYYIVTPLILIFFGSFLIGLTGAMMPGPLLTVTISHSTRQGFIAGPLIVLGHAILESALVLAIGFGLGKLLQIPIVTGFIGIFGGAILLWMGIGMVRATKIKLQVQEATDKTKGQGIRYKGQNTSHLFRTVLDGIIISLANPYWIIWWTSIGLTLITAAWKNGIFGIIFFFLGHIASDFAWYTSVSTAVAAGKKIMTDSVYRIIIGICGMILIGFACYYGIGGIMKLW
jgi:threonine/homoserine/homoserine lactone efflux protein